MPVLVLLMHLHWQEWHFNTTQTFLLGGWLSERELPLRCVMPFQHDGSITRCLRSKSHINKSRSDLVEILPGRAGCTCRLDQILGTLSSIEEGSSPAGLDQEAKNIRSTIPKRTSLWYDHNKIKCYYYFTINSISLVRTCITPGNRFMSSMQGE